MNSNPKRSTRISRYPFQLLLVLRGARTGNDKNWKLEAGVKTRPCNGLTLGRATSPRALSPNSVGGEGEKRLQPFLLIGFQDWQIQIFRQGQPALWSIGLQPVKMALNGIQRQCHIKCCIGLNGVVDGLPYYWRPQTGCAH